MAIKFGPKSPNQVKQIAQRNFGRANKYYPAQQELDYITSRASAQVTEAIEVDGVDLVYWKKSSEGRFCSCQLRQGFNSDSDPSDFDDPPPITVRQSSHIIDNQKNPTMVITDGPFSGTVIGELPESESGNSFNPDTNEKEQNIFDYITNPEDSAQDIINQDSYLNNPEAGVVFGGEKSPCGICFKTGHVGGYQLLQGSRIILDSTSDYNMDMQGFDINTDDRPFTFNSANDPTNFVIWTLEIPKYFEKVNAIVVRNNLTINIKTVIEFKPQSGGDWTVISPQALNQFKRTKTTLLIRVRPKERKLDGFVQFTHVELVFQTAPWIKCQIAPLEKTTNFAIFQGAQTRIASIVLPPSLPNVSFDDVMLDSKYGILWKTSSVTDNMTATRQIMGWQINAREVHPDEMTYLLKVTSIPYIELSYTGLEAIQGGSFTNDDRYK